MPGNASFIGLPMIDPAEEAENCRRQALAYLGRPEARFLVQVARGFDQLANGEQRGCAVGERSGRS
jgi:hypothetical protein